MWWKFFLCFLVRNGKSIFICCVFFPLDGCSFWGVMFFISWDECLHVYMFFVTFYRIVIFFTWSLWMKIRSVQGYVEYWIKSKKCLCQIFFQNSNRSHCYKIVIKIRLWAFGDIFSFIARWHEKRFFAQWTTSQKIDLIWLSNSQKRFQLLFPKKRRQNQIFTRIRTYFLNNETQKIFSQHSIKHCNEKCNRATRNKKQKTDITKQTESGENFHSQICFQTVMFFFVIKREIIIWKSTKKYLFHLFSNWTFDCFKVFI